MWYAFETFMFSGMMLSNWYTIVSMRFLNVKFQRNGHLSNVACRARSPRTAASTFYSFCSHSRALARWHHQRQLQRATWLPYCWPSADEPASETAILYSILLRSQDFRLRSIYDPSRSEQINVSTANLSRSHPVTRTSANTSRLHFWTFSALITVLLTVQS